MIFCDWLFTHSIMFKRFLSVVYHLSVLNSFLWSNNPPLSGYTIFSLFISRWDIGIFTFGCVNNAMIFYMSLCGHNISLWYISRSGTVVVMVTLFNHLRNCQTVSKVATPFHSPSSSVRVGFSPSLPTLVTVLFF